MIRCGRGRLVLDQYAITFYRSDSVDRLLARERDVCSGGQPARSLDGQAAGKTLNPIN
jgi:hypothetical protein